MMIKIEDHNTGVSNEKPLRILKQCLIKIIKKYFIKNFIKNLKTNKLTN